MALLHKRLIATLFTFVAVVLTLQAVQWTRDHLGDESTLTGWALLVSTLGLFLLTARKRRLVGRLGPVSAWLQAHVYTGTFASAVFLMHIGWPVRGPFEQVLAACFVLVSVSGVVLGFMSRRVPKRLAAISQDYRFEEIPALQVQLAIRAHQLAIESAESGNGATLAEYYQRRLLPYFQLPRSWVYRWFPNGIKRRQLLRELNDLDRYLAELGYRQRLSELVHRKDDLDFHAALQMRLRWLFAMHVALTWTLSLLIVIHVVLVYRFQGVM